MISGNTVAGAHWPGAPLHPRVDQHWTASFLQGPPIPSPTATAGQLPESQGHSPLSVLRQMSDEGPVFLCRSLACDLRRTDSVLPEVLAGGSSTGSPSLRTGLSQHMIRHMCVASHVSSYLVSNSSLFTVGTFYSEVTVDSPATVRNDTEQSCVPFTQFQPR